MLNSLSLNKHCVSQSCVYHILVCLGLIFPFLVFVLVGNLHSTKSPQISTSNTDPQRNIFIYLQELLNFNCSCYLQLQENSQQYASSKSTQNTQMLLYCTPYSHTRITYRQEVEIHKAFQSCSLLYGWQLLFNAPTTYKEDLS